MPLAAASSSALIMGRISKADRQLQMQKEAAGDHMYANRVRVYPKAVHGPVRRTKWLILGICLAVYYALPWLRWDRGPGRPSQAVLLDVWNARFYLFNIELWPQDIYFLTGLLILAAVGLFLVTSLFGRVWCGYTCPQTVWTDLFMQIERMIEGDRNERMRRDAEPMTIDAARRKALKHAAWLFIAFWTGGAWIMYYVDAPTVTVEFWTGNASAAVYFFAGLFTLTTYALAGWAREQVCTYMCPWPRFQAAMLDEQTVTVTYQGWRGEPRERGRRDAASLGGDCIDCGACVTACPTGIDIRDGIQLECINCGLCVDACNHVMERVDRPRGLITWDSLARQSAKAIGRSERLRLLRPRSLIYAGAMVIALTAMSIAFVTRSSVELSVERDRAPLFVQLPDGSIRNGYTVRIVNKTGAHARFELRVDGLPGARLALADAISPPGLRLTLLVETDAVSAFRVLVTAPRDIPVQQTREIEFLLSQPATFVTTRYRSTFRGPE
jgi:cytochrome c oxidase accessory protein FixG